MNTPNNKRKKESKDKIEKCFIELIQTREVEDVSVTDICKKTGLNRSTFYANYIDIYDLVDKLKDRMIKDWLEIYKDEADNNYHSYDFLKLFRHIKDNQLFYKTYFKLNFDLDSPLEFADTNEVLKFLDTTKHLDYHIEFFKAGINAIIKKWLHEGCKKTPEELIEIIEAEYKGRKIEL